MTAEFDEKVQRIYEQIPLVAISANVTGDFGIVTAGDRMLGCAAWIVLVSVNLSFRSTSFASRVCP